jgi:hypothetical protein
MATTSSTKNPTRVSERIRNYKKAAAATAAAPAAAHVATKNARKGKGKAKTNRKASPSKITKRIPKKASSAKAKVYAVHHRFFMEPEQLSTVVEQHNADNNNDQMWVGGKFYAAGPGEDIPAGAIEIVIKVPSGLKFLQFPDILKLMEGEEEEGEAEEGEEEGSMEEDEHEGERPELNV